MISFPRYRVLRNVTGTSLVLLLCVGCGGSGELSGNVSFKGKPLKGGYVTFVSKDDGRTYPSVIDSDGGYKIARLPTGEYKICVDTEFLKGDTLGSAMPTQRSGGGPKKPVAPPPDEKDKDKGNISAHNDEAAKSGYTPSNMNASAMKKANLDKYVQLPLDYRSPQTSRKEYTVTAGKVVYNVELD